MTPLLVCGKCGATLSTMAEAIRHCPSGDHEDAWHVSPEAASRDPAEHCSRLELREWKASGQSRRRP